MKRLSFTFFFYFNFLRFALATSPTYEACQLQKPSGESPLSGCPEGTIYVSPTDTSADFNTVQEAINSLDETGSAVILIGEGEYYESLKVTRSAPITLLGQLNSTTASLSAADATQCNLVVIWNKACTEEGSSDEDTATLAVAPAPYASFGNTDFRVYNIDFENRIANYSVAPALVTTFTYTNASFYGCTFASWQDTWYTGWGANTYVVDSTIYGEVDYLFGMGIGWFQSVTLASRGCGGAITAWAGTAGTQNGVYISHSRIIRSPEAEAAVATKNCYLGRPWNPNAVAVFLRNYMDDSIQPAGFTPWVGETTLPDTAYFAEYGSYGPGGSTSARASGSHVLSTSEVESQYTLQQVFGGRPHWIDFGYEY